MSTHRMRGFSMPWSRCPCPNGHYAANHLFCTWCKNWCEAAKSCPDHRYESRVSAPCDVRFAVFVMQLVDLPWIFARSNTALARGESTCKCYYVCDLRRSCVRFCYMFCAITLAIFVMCYLLFVINFTALVVNFMLCVVSFLLGMIAV